MSAKPKILLVRPSGAGEDDFTTHVQDHCDVVVVEGPSSELPPLEDRQFAAVCFTVGKEGVTAADLFQSQRILQGMPDGVALLDDQNTILWTNERLCQWCNRSDIVGENFYRALGSPEIIGPDFCPFHTALATGRDSSSTLRTPDNRFFQVHAGPVDATLSDESRAARRLIVVVRDTTREVLQQQKLAAIHQAGTELADLKPGEISQMEVADRIELLKSNILHYTQDLLHYDVIEIRLLDAQTGRLKPLLSVGMDEEAAKRPLYALTQGNGVTGFVAATGKSYLCEDTTQDPLYIEGAKGAKSSLTVPLILHEEVIGTFNVESPEPRAFNEGDLQFLELFSREIAVALNTLDLLAAEQASTAARSAEAIYSAVALSVDDILNDAVSIMERYIGHQTELAERLQNILRNARAIKQTIQQVGVKMATREGELPWQAKDRPKLRDRAVLVVDADHAVRSAAHQLLERYGCVVETAHNGEEALCMVRSLGPDARYDCIIADIRLPDMNGYEFMCKLSEVVDPVPLALMTGFGYDASHSIVKARQAGLKAVLYKPFRLDQLLDAVEMVASGSVARAADVVPQN